MTKNIEVLETQVNIINPESPNWGYSTQQFSLEPLQQAQIVEVNVPLATEKVVAPACRISTNLEDPNFNSW